MSPNNCWLANTVITIQSVYALLLNAVVLGIVFARISRPGQRVGFRWHVHLLRHIAHVLLVCAHLWCRTCASGAWLASR